MRDQKILLVSNTDWYLYNFRLSLAKLLRDEGWDVVLVSPPGAHAKYFHELNFRWIRVPMSRRGVFPITEYWTYRCLKSIYRRENPLIVHHHTIKPNIYGTLAARAAGVPNIVDSITGLGYVFLSDNLLVQVLAGLIKPIYRMALASPKVHVVFENSGDYQFFLEDKLVSEKQSTIIEGVGVDLHSFRPSAEPDGEPIVVLASRMLWDKGVGEFVESARIVRAGGVEARFALVGVPDPGNPSSVPRRQLERWAKEGVVDWWGRREDMPEVIRKCHIVVLYSKAEGAPRILLEASASGRPVVASDIPGCRDIVKHGETGFLVEAGSAQALAVKIKELLVDKPLREKMGASGRIWMEQRFDVELINRRTLDVYRSALGSNS